MPEGSVPFARGIYQVRTPAHLVPLREHVRSEHHGALAQLRAAIEERFGTNGARDDYVNVFYAAGEMALMELVGRRRLPPQDRRTLRHLWESLLSANY